MSRHKTELLKNKHDNELLQADYNKYGYECFVYDIIDKCPEYMLEYYENKYIDKFDSINCGYNKIKNNLPKREQKKFSATLRDDGLYMSRIQYHNRKKYFYGKTEEESIKKVEYWYFSQLYLDSNYDDDYYDNDYNNDFKEYDNKKNIKKLSNKIDALVELIDVNIDVLESKQLLKPYITVDELSSILKITKNRAYELVNRSDFPKVKIGKCIRIPQIELEKYLKHNLYKEIKIK